MLEGGPSAPSPSGGRSLRGVLQVASPSARARPLTGWKGLWGLLLGAPGLLCFRDCCGKAQKHSDLLRIYSLYSDVTVFRKSPVEVRLLL